VKYLCGDVKRATGSREDVHALAVVAGKVHVVEGVVRGTVDDLLEGMVDDHVRVVDLGAERERLQSS
jgi:hypothetical protein